MQFESIQKLKAIYHGTRYFDNYEVEKDYQIIPKKNKKVYFIRIKRTDLKIKASVLYVHGLGEHCSRN